MAGRGRGQNGAVEKEAVSYQCRGRPRVLSQVSKEKLYVGVVGARGPLFREGPAWVHLCISSTITQSGNLHHTVIFTPQVFGSQPCLFSFASV